MNSSAETRVLGEKQNVLGDDYFRALCASSTRLGSRPLPSHDHPYTPAPLAHSLCGSHSMSSRTSLRRPTRMSGKDEKHTPIQRSRVKNKTAAHAAAGMHVPSVRHIQVVMVVRAESLQDATHGCFSMYTGPAMLVLNGISSLRTPNGDTLHLLPGSRVRVCTRKVIPFDRDGDFRRIHFSAQAIGHVSNCRCGACDSTFSLIDTAPVPCNCGSEEFDEGAQTCNIM